MAEMLPAGPADDGVYHLYQMCYARRAGSVHEMLMFRDMHDGPMPLDYYVWILRNRHRTILVDTGFGPRVAAQRQRARDFDPIDTLRQIGVDPDAIEDVIVTHLHYDHAGNIDRFAKARFHVQDAEAAFATGRCMCEGIFRFPFDVEDIVAFVRHTFAERVSFHDGDAAPLPGISLHILPGHSKGLQAVRVMTPRGPIVLASDCCHFYANLLRRSPFVLTIDAEATMRSYDRLAGLAGGIDRIVPGHDPKVRRLYPEHQVGGISLAALHETPLPHRAEELSRIDDF